MLLISELKEYIHKLHRHLHLHIKFHVPSLYIRCLVLVQLRKTCPEMTEKLMAGM